MTRAINAPTAYRSPRRPVSEHFSILNNLTQRDIQICLDIYEHRFLTTRQIGEMHFSSFARARVRTFQLFQMQILDRFRPPQRPGSKPWHYVLDRVGTEIVAGIRDVDAREVYFRRNRPSKLARSQLLEHISDLNDFFCRLTYECRQREGHRVSRWLGEDGARAFCHGVARPDGLGVIEGPQGQTSFFLELDRATESSERLREKLFDYTEVVLSPQMPKILLVCFPTPGREQRARPAFRTSKLTVATSTLDRHLQDPLGPNWITIDSDHRLPLLDLPGGQGQDEDQTPPGWRL